MIDCSVALKWVLEEDDRSKAVALLGQSLWAPDFLLLECANVLAMKVRAGEVEKDRAVEALSEITDRSGINWRSMTPYIPRAQAMAMRLRQTVYDCLYLAMAMQDGRLLVTADKRFASAVENDPLYKALISRL